MTEKTEQRNEQDNWIRSMLSRDCPGKELYNMLPEPPQSKTKEKVIFQGSAQIPEEKTERFCGILAA